MGVQSSRQQLSPNVAQPPPTLQQVHRHPGAIEGAGKDRTFSSLRNIRSGQRCCEWFFPWLVVTVVFTVLIAAVVGPLIAVLVTGNVKILAAYVWLFGAPGVFQGGGCPWQDDDSRVPGLGSLERSEMSDAEHVREQLHRLEEDVGARKHWLRLVICGFSATQQHSDSNLAGQLHEAPQLVEEDVFWEGPLRVRSIGAPTLRGCSLCCRCYDVDVHDPETTAGVAFDSEAEQACFIRRCEAMRERILAQHDDAYVTWRIDTSDTSSETGSQDFNEGEKYTTYCCLGRRGGLQLRPFFACATICCLPCCVWLPCCPPSAKYNVVSVALLPTRGSGGGAVLEMDSTPREDGRSRLLEGQTGHRMPTVSQEP